MVLQRRPAWLIAWRRYSRDLPRYQIYRYISSPSSPVHGSEVHLGKRISRVSAPPVSLSVTIGGDLSREAPQNEKTLLKYLPFCVGRRPLEGFWCSMTSQGQCKASYVRFQEGCFPLQIALFPLPRTLDCFYICDARMNGKGREGKAELKRIVFDSKACHQSLRRERKCVAGPKNGDPELTSVGMF